MGKGWRPVQPPQQPSEQQPEQPSIQQGTESQPHSAQTTTQGVGVDPPAPNLGDLGSTVTAGLGSLGGYAGQGLLGESATEPMPVPAPAIPAATLNIDDLTPDQLARIRQLAVARGIAVGEGTGKLPDGSLRVVVTLEPMTVEQLELWAESDNLTLEEEAQRRISESLQNYLYGDWSSTPEPEPAPVVAAATK
jgi:hypothetical protein